MTLLSINNTSTTGLIVSLVVWLLFATTCRAQNTLDFSKDTNLRAVYDAGLRPWRVRPDETHSLKITDQHVRIIASEAAAPFALDVEIGNFRVLARNDLGSAEFISKPMNISATAAKAREICQALNIQTAGLEEKLAEFTKLGRQTPVPQYWNGRGESKGVRFEVTVTPLFGFDETRGKVMVAFDFYSPGKATEPLAEPIKPPPGYEHMSMEPPKTHPKKPFPDPAYSRENMQKRH